MYITSFGQCKHIPFMSIIGIHVCMVWVLNVPLYLVMFENLVNASIVGPVRLTRVLFGIVSAY